MAAHRSPWERSIAPISSALAPDLLERWPDVIGGLPVVRGTRVPAKALLDYLGASDSLDSFLDDFPSVRHEQASCCWTSRRAIEVQ